MYVLELHRNPPDPSMLFYIDCPAIALFSPPEPS